MTCETLQSGFLICYVTALTGARPGSPLFFREARRRALRLGVPMAAVRRVAAMTERDVRALFGGDADRLGPSATRTADDAPDRPAVHGSPSGPGDAGSASAPAAGIVWGDPLRPGAGASYSGRRVPRR